VTAGWLAGLVGDISKVLVDLSMSPIPRIPQGPSNDIDILEIVGTVLELLREAYAFSTDP
jgi:hypothetical protein